MKRFVSRYSNEIFALIAGLAVGVIEVGGGIACYLVFG